MLLIPNKFPEWCKDIIRASCISIAFLWFIMCFYIIGYDKIMQIILELFPFINKDVGAYLIPISDMLIHYMPILLIGLPKNIYSVIYAVLIIYTWYFVINYKTMYINDSKHTDQDDNYTKQININTVYGVELSQEMLNKIIYIYFPLINIIIICILYILKVMK
jgi:hypothetical protein